MDEAIVRYYRNLSRYGYKYSGSVDKPSFVLKDESGGKIRICSSIGSYVHIFFKISGDKITSIRYLCTCNPVTHVSIEILCTLLEGKILDDAKKITAASFCQVLGSDSEELCNKASTLIEFVQGGIDRYRRNPM